MKDKMKKFGAWLLAAALAFAGASAAQAETVAKIGNKDYATLAAAVAEAQAGNTVSLVANTAENVVIDKSIVLDLGDATVSGTVEASGTVTIKAKEGGIAGGSSSAIKFKSGSLIVDGGNYSSEKDEVLVATPGDLGSFVGAAEFPQLVLKLTGGANFSLANGASSYNVVLSVFGTDLTVENATIANNATASYNDAINANALNIYSKRSEGFFSGSWVYSGDDLLKTIPSKVTICSGATVKTASSYGTIIEGEKDCAVEVSIKGGTFETAGDHAYILDLDENNGVAVIEGGSFTLTGNSSIVTSAKECQIKGGTFDIPGESQYMFCKGVVVSGGTFSHAFDEKYCAEGFKIKVDPNTGKVVVGEAIDAVAKIGTTEYETLGAAFAAAKKGDTVELLAASYGENDLTDIGKLGDKNVTVVGLGMDKTELKVVYGQGASDVNGLHFQDLTLTINHSGYGMPYTQTLCGTYERVKFNGLIAVDHGTSSFTDCVFTGTTTGDEYILWQYGGYMMVERCTFKASASKGVVKLYCESSNEAQNLVKDCVFLSVTGSKGCAIYASNSNNIDKPIYEMNIVGNTIPDGVAEYLASGNGLTVVNPVKDATGKFTSGTFISGNADKGTVADIISGVLAENCAIVLSDDCWTVGVKITDETIVTTKQQESKVEVPAEVVQDEEVAEKIEQSTKVEGVKLSATADGGKASGIVAVVEEAKKNTEFAAAVEAAAEVSVKVEVEVKPTKFDNTADKGKVAFKLTPKATVTVVQEEKKLEQVVPVTNDMIDQNQKIAVSIYTGFKPVAITHDDDKGARIETFEGDDQIVYNEQTGVATVQISHFSTLTGFGNVNDVPAPKVYVAQIGETPYETLVAAVAAVEDGQTVTLVDNVTLTTALQIGKKVTLDLSTFKVTAAAECNAIEVIAGGQLTINADATNPGHIVCGEGKRSIFTDNTAFPGRKSVVINGGVFDGVCEFNVWGSGRSGEKTTPLDLVINDGLFNDEVIGYRLYHATVNGGTFEKRCEFGTTSTCYSAFKGGKFKVEPGSNNPGAIGIGDDSSKGIRIFDAVCYEADGYFHVIKTANIPADAVAKVGTTCYYLNIGDALAKALTTPDDNRNTITLLKEVDVTGLTQRKAIVIAPNGKTVVGVTTPAEANCVVARDSAGNVVVVDETAVVAAIGDLKFTTLQAAVDAANAMNANSIMIKLLCDIEVTETLEINNVNKKTVTFNANGRHITAKTTMFNVKTTLAFNGNQSTTPPQPLAVVECPEEDPIFTVEAGVTFNIQDAMFSKDVSDLIDQHRKACVKNDQNYYEVVWLNDQLARERGYVVRMGEPGDPDCQYYESISALAAAGNTQFNLIANVTEDVEISGAKKGFTVYAGDYEYTGSFTFDTSKWFSLMSGKAHLTTYVGGSLNVYYGSEVTVDDGNIGDIYVDKDSTLVLRGGTYRSDPTDYVDTDNYDVVKNDDGTWTVQEKAVCQIGDVKYPSLAAAVAAVPTDGTMTTIKMIANEAFAGAEGKVAIASTKNVVLDLNGCTLSYTTEGYGAFISNNGTLEITDTSDGQLGKITAKFAKPDWMNGCYTVDNGNDTSGKSSAKLIITAGTIENTSDAGLAWPVNNGSWGSNAETTINGGTIHSVNYVPVRQYLHYVGVKKLVINGGTFVSANSRAIAVQFNDASVQEGEASVIINGGDFSCNGSGIFYMDLHQANVDTTGLHYEVNGGKFKNANKTVPVVVYDNESKDQSSAKLVTKFIKGGIFSAKPADDTIAEGYAFVENTDPETKDAYPWAVGEVATEVASVISADGTTTNKFATLPEALDAATDGQTVQLIADCGLTGTEPYVLKKSIGIDLNGKTLALKRTEGKAVKQMLFIGTDGGTADSNAVTLYTSVKGGKVTFDDKGGSTAGIRTCSATTLTVGRSINDIPVIIESNKFGIYAADSSHLVVNSVDITAQGASAISTNGSNSPNAVVTINGGEFESKAAEDTAIYNPSGILIIHGGTFVGIDAVVWIRGGSLTIDGGVFSATGPAKGGLDNGDAIVVESCNYPAGVPVVSITGGAFSSANGSVIGSYHTGSAPEDLSHFVKGGVYNKAPAESTVAEGYEVQANAEPFTKDDYQWAVAKKAFVPAEDPETGKVEPITIDITPAGGTQAIVPVKVSEDAVKAMVNAGIVTPAGEKATAAEVSDGLAQKQNNDQTVWQNYVMGIDGTTEQNMLATIGEKRADKPEEVVVVKTPITEFNPPQNTGVTVTYNLLRKRPGETKFSVFQEGLLKPEVDVNTIELDVGDTLWKFEAVFSAEKP